MSAPELCPACLAVLPEGYPYDHVAIDTALGRRPELFRGMSRAEKTEVVVLGVERGASLNQLADRFGWANADLRMLLPDEHPQRRVGERPDFETAVRSLWEQDLPDAAIAARVGCSADIVFKIRKRLRLPSKYAPGGRRKRVTGP